MQSAPFPLVQILLPRAKLAGPPFRIERACPTAAASLHAIACSVPHLTHPPPPAQVDQSTADSPASPFSAVPTDQPVRPSRGCRQWLSGKVLSLPVCPEAQFVSA